MELNYLFDLYKRITENLYDMMRKNHVNFRFAGDKSQLPSHLIDFINEKESEFVFPNSPKTFVLAVNYGWQDEILRAMKKLAGSWDEITKENLEKYMDFGWLPTVDLVIRTKQKLAKRLSGFMLRWIGYAQLYFTDLYCPQFTVDEFNKAIQWRNDTLWTQNFWK